MDINNDNDDCVDDDNNKIYDNLEGFICKAKIFKGLWWVSEINS